MSEKHSNHFFTDSLTTLDGGREEEEGEGKRELEIGRRRRPTPAQMLYSVFVLSTEKQSSETLADGDTLNSTKLELCQFPIPGTFLPIFSQGIMKWNVFFTTISDSELFWELKLSPSPSENCRVIRNTLSMVCKGQREIAIPGP